MELSFFRLIQHADPVVQFVMLALAAASLLCWTICFEKVLRYVAFFLQVRRMERFIETRGVTESWLASRFQLLAKEEMPDAGESRSAFQDRIERTLAIETGSQLSRLQSGLPILATVGATAPFVGLFGTVWGIMNSFTGIAAAQDTSLPVVAPGIAEALLATAIGLAAAIPAVIFYNSFSQSASRLSQRFEAFADEFSAIVSRQLDLKA